MDHHSDENDFLGMFASEQNPYAPPAPLESVEQEILLTEDGRPPLKPTVARFGKVTGTTWQIFRRHMFTCFTSMLLTGFVMFALASVVSVAISFPVSAVLTSLDKAEKSQLAVAPGSPSDTEGSSLLARNLGLDLARLAVMVAVTIIMSVIPLWCGAGLARFYTEMIRHGNVRYALIFSGFRAVVPLLGYYVIASLIFIGILILTVVVPMVAAHLVNEVAVAFIGFVIGFCFLMLAFVYLIPGWWLLTDRKMPVTEAVKRSMKMANMNLETVLLLLVWGWVLNILFAIAAGLLFFILPVSFIVAVLLSSYLFMYWIVFCMMASGERLAQ